MLTCRFFCPAILLPTSSGIIEEVPSETVKRGLLLITKILQNLSNDILYKDNEEYPKFPRNFHLCSSYMMPFNEWMIQKQPILRDYFQKLVPIFFFPELKI